jgi:hypothetical protein
MRHLTIRQPAPLVGQFEASAVRHIRLEQPVNNRLLSRLGL